MKAFTSGLGGRVPQALIHLVVLVAAAAALAGCGSSSSSSSSASASSTSSTPTSTASSTSSAAAAVKANPKPIPGVKSPAGAVALSKSSVHKLAKVHKGTGASAHLVGLDNVPVTQQIQTLSGDINHFWSSLFARGGVRWPQMQEVLVQSQAVQTQCSGRATVTPTEAWFLCDGSNGGTFYWTVPWIQQNIATDPGGVSLAFNMAEVYGYHILNLAGATAQVVSGQLPKRQWAEQAMCLTGLYVRTIGDRKLFEKGDQHAVQSFLSGLSVVSGIGAPDVSNQQLQQAFVAGFNGGDISTCGLSFSPGGNGGGTATQTQSQAPTQTSGGQTSPAPISPLPATTTG